MPLKEIRGQKRAVELLKSAVAQSRLAHAYLFLGPKGVGKVKTAIEFTKFLNCGSSGDDCCGSCPSCIKIDRSIYPDLFFISKDKDATRIPIDSIRELQKRLSLKPFEARYKVAIIAEADDMSEEASNCLLKVLEEPNPETVFILTTSKEKLLPRTIVSRCQIIRFRPLTRDEVDDILTKDFSIEEEEARFLSVVSDANVEKALDLKGKDTLAWKNSVIDIFAAHAIGPAQHKSDILNFKRRQQLEAMDMLLNFYRDILVYKHTGDDKLLINIDRRDAIAGLAKEMDTEKVSSCMMDIEQAKRQLEANANPKLVIKALSEKLAI